jgi:hypothetical protein
MHAPCPWGSLSKLPVIKKNSSQCNFTSFPNPSEGNTGRQASRSTESGLAIPDAAGMSATYSTNPTCIIRRASFSGTLRIGLASLPKLLS